MIIVIKNIAKIDDEKCEKLASLLPPSRKEKLSQKSIINRKIAIIEYFLLKKALKFENYPDFSYNENGKPMLEGYNFSISHSGDTLAIATSKRQVGVDIEKVFPYKQKIARFIANNDELKKLDKAKNKSLALTKLFVQKEAAIKCLGLNLSHIKNILNEGKFKFKFKKLKPYLLCVAEL